MRGDMSWNCHSIADMPDLLTQKDGQFKIFAPDRDGKKKKTFAAETVWKGH